jgi:cytochrome c-type biogenesis protein CcmH
MKRAVLALLLLVATQAWAVEPSERLADPALEGRARDISRELRCLVCQNQSIDDSNADLARDLRRVVRERLQAGDSNTAVIGYVTARYGDFVLLTPPFKAATWALWLGPPALLIAGFIAWLMFLRRRGAMAETPLSDEEQRRIASLLDQSK